MNKPSCFFLTVVVTTTICLSAIQPWGELFALSQVEWRGILCLILLGILAEVRTVQFSIGDHAAGASIAFIAQFAIAILFPAPAAILATAIMYSVAQSFIHKRAFARALFNVSQLTLAMCFALLVFHSLGGVHGGDIKRLPFISFIGLAATFFFVNQLVCSVMIALMQGGKVGATFARLISGAGANLAYDVLVSPITYMVVVLYTTMKE